MHDAADPALAGIPRGCAARAGRARARRDGPRRGRERGGDGAARRAGDAPRSRRRRDAAPRDGGVAARDRRLGGLARSPRSSNGRSRRTSRSSASRSSSTTRSSRASSAAIRTNPRPASGSRARRCGSRSRLRPERIRRRVLRSLRGTRTAAAVLAGPPSVAHAEALLRAIELRRATLDEPLDALVIGIPGTTPFLPREPPNPLLAAHLGLAHALGLWRDAFPVARRRRRHPRPRLPARLRPADAAAVPRLLPLRPDRARPRAARAPRRMRSPRTRAPSRSTAPAAPSIRCCRSATGRPAGPRSSGSAPSTSRALATPSAVRQLGFVPIGGIGAALQMARGQRGPDARIGFLLAPPYFPLRVGSGEA